MHYSNLTHLQEFKGRMRSISQTATLQIRCTSCRGHAERMFENNITLISKTQNCSPMFITSNEYFNLNSHNYFIVILYKTISGICCVSSQWTYSLYTAHHCDTPQYAKCTTIPFDLSKTRESIFIVVKIESIIHICVSFGLFETLYTILTCWHFKQFPS